MTVIRILHRKPDGKVFDGQHDFELEDFAGQVPMIGDAIVDPGVLQGLDRNHPENRTVWIVVGRVVNARDNKEYVSLIVESRSGTLADEAFL